MYIQIKQVNYIIYFGTKNHYIFTINDPKVQYLIQNIDKGNLHINIATNHYIEKISDTITTNLVIISFHIKDASLELIAWAKKNNIYYDDNTYYPRYSYQVLINAQRYLADNTINNHIKKNEPKLSMSFETLVNPNNIQLTPSPIKIINGQPYLNDSLLFEVIDYGWKMNSQYRKITYKENVNN